MNIKKTGFFTSIFCLICLIFAVTAIYAATIPEFKIMTEEWEPYNFTKDGVVQGISTDMLALMLERVKSPQGRDDIKIYPWVRAFETTKKQPNTILFTTTRTEEREKLFKWVGPIFEIEFSLYALKSRKIKINSFADLKKYRIGTLRGDVVEDLLVKNAGLKVSDFDQASENILNTKKLAYGRIDLAAQTKDTTTVTCKELGLNPDDFEPVFRLDRKCMYYAFNKDTPDSVIKKFQRAFDDLKNEGKLSKIFSKYGK